MSNQNLASTPTSGKNLATSATATTAQQTMVASAFLKQAAAAANSVMGAKLHADLVALQYPAQGDFNWSYTNGNNLNGATYSYISGAVTQSNVDPNLYQLGASTSFPNAYQQLLNQILFQFSTADQVRLQSSITQSSTQAASVVSAFNATYGAPTAADYAAANACPAISAYPPLGPNNEIDFITLYAMGYMWAGKPAQGLTLKVMQAAPNLSNLLPSAPASASGVIMAVTAYLNALGAGAQLQDEQSNANWTLAQLKGNVGNPGATNGGIQVYNNTASQPPGSYALGYSLSPSTASILQQLQNPGSVASFSFSAQTTSQSEYNVSFQGSAGMSFGGFLLGYSAGTSVQGDIASVQGAGSSMSIEASYPGLTPISVAAQGWNGASFESPGGQTTGWWYEAVLAQALQNFNAGAGAQTGFTFGSKPSVPIGAPDTTGYASTLVVSGYPTIKVTFSNGSYSSFSQWLKTQTRMSISLFGCIPLGSASVNTYSASATQGSSNSSFTLTLTPPAPGGVTIDPSQQTVPVLGVAATWAGQASS
jgi:hypothetical protein